SSRIIRYARSRPNGKMIVDSIENGPYLRRMIATPGELDLLVPVPETFYEQTNEELIEIDIKRMDADDQAIKTILLGLPEYVYVAVDSYETAKEIWERVRQMMKGSDIGEQVKKAKLFNEWEKFTSTDGESIESYYQRFMQLMNDLKRNKHFPENITPHDQAIQTILLGLPEEVYAAIDSCEITKEIWERVRQMMKGSDIREHEKKAKLFNEWEKFTNKHFPENIASNLKFLNNLQPEWKRHVTIVRQTNNLYETDFTQIYDFLKMNQEEYNPQPSLNPNFMQPPMTSLEDINDPTEAMNTALILFAKAFQLSTPTNNNQRTSSNPYNCQIAQPNGGIQGAQNAGVQSSGNKNGLVVVLRIANQSGTGNVVAARAEGTGNGNQARCYNFRGLGHIARNCTARPRRRDVAYLQTQLLIAQKGKSRAPVYDTDGLAEEEQYTDLLEPIPKPQLVPQNDNHVTSITPRDFVPHTTKSKEELFLSNVSNTVTIPKTISIPNEDLSDDTTPSVTRKFLNEVKSSFVTLQCVVKQKMTLEIHNWSSSAHKEVHRIISHEIAPVINQVEARVENFEIQFLVTIPKTISIPNEDLSDDTTPSVARKFLNEVKSSFVTLQCVVKQKMTLEIHNWSSSAHKEVYRIISHEIAPVINQVDARVQNFEIQFLQEVAKFVRDFKSLAKEADESLQMQKSLELKIERLLKASVSHDIISIVKNSFVDVPSDL
nr:hypothetical protein [Tanacetum cinerariifolium]